MSARTTKAVGVVCPVCGEAPVWRVQDPETVYDGDGNVLSSDGGGIELTCPNKCLAVSSRYSRDKALMRWRHEAMKLRSKE